MHRKPFLTSSCEKIKVKSLRFIRNHATNAYWRSEGTALRVLNLDSWWRWMVSFTPRQIYLGRNSPRYPLDRRGGGPQSRSERDAEERKYFACPCR